MKTLSPDEKKWLNIRFPELKINESENGYTLAGNLIVDMFFDETSDDRYVIFPDVSVHSSEYYISDVYQVLVDYKNGYFVPAVQETSGRIKAFALRRNIKSPDLHINDDGKLCLCPKPLEKVRLNDTYTIQDFFTILLIPFLYAQSYFEKFNRWPWKDYSHYDLGILECYANCLSQARDKKQFVEETVDSLSPKNQTVIRSADRITRQSVCFCNSGSKFRQCHPEAWKVAKRLKEEIQALYTKA